MHFFPCLVGWLVKIFWGGVQALYDYLDAYGDIEFLHYEVATNMPKVVYNDKAATLGES